MVPSKNFTVENVGEIIGYDHPVEAIDVITQSLEENLTMADWIKYFKKPRHERKKTLNVISLEFSNTDLVSHVKPPTIVREMDWIKYWPKSKYQAGLWPRVQNYCLMSTADCYTDFHIDLGGTSVWYHVHTGEKHFIFAAPTRTNMKAYEIWSMTPKQKRRFLPEIIKDCFLVTLTEGQTLMIPTGWIHGVYTPVDSLVFGGNFLHSKDIAGQLRIYALEVHTNVPRKYMLPFFEQWHWYVAQAFLALLRSGKQLEKLAREHLPCFIGHLSTWHSDSLTGNRDEEYRRLTISAANDAARMALCIGPLDMLAELGARGRGDVWKSPPSGEGLDLDKFYEHNDGDSEEEVDVKPEKKRKRESNTNNTGRVVKLKLTPNAPLEPGSWRVSCLCGASGINYDDGKRMVECVGCLTWMHTACYGIPDNNDPPDDIFCSSCVAKNELAQQEESKDWMVNCTCGAKGKNYDDGGRMVECSKCMNWVHTLCSGVKDNIDPPDDFVCKRCKLEIKQKENEKAKVEKEALKANARAKAASLAKSRAQRASNRNVQEKDEEISGVVIFNCVCGIKGKDLYEDDLCATCSRCNVRFHTACADLDYEDVSEIPDDIMCPGCLAALKAKETVIKLPRAAVQRQLGDHMYLFFYMIHSLVFITR